MAHQTWFRGTCALRALVVTGALAAPAALLAGPVSLSSPDGTIDLSGEYIGFEDNMHIINTAVGELRVAADKVTCEGASCPVAVSADVTDPTPPSNAGLTFAGSETVGTGLMPLLIEGWAASKDAIADAAPTTTDDQIMTTITGDQGFGDPLNSIVVTSSTSRDAFGALVSRTADFGMTSRPVNTDEARDLRNAGAGDITDPAREHIIAVDSLVAIVHPENPVQVLNADQLRGIFSGRITNWSQVGGTDAAITLYDRAAGSDSRTAFMGALFANPPRQVAGAQIATTNAEMSDAVAADPSAIGFVGYAFQRGARPVGFENECGMIVQPDSFSARTEEYDFQRRLYLYNTAAGATPTAQDFLDYVQSADADEMIEKAGFISLGVSTREQDFNSTRAQALLQPTTDQFEGSKMREMLGTMIGFDRLSSTFRFTTGSSQLDRRAPLDMERLAVYLQQMPAGTQVKFVGFTDSVGTYENNQNLSERRAAQVMETMQEFAGDRLDGIQFASTGFGEVAPTACNINDGGREINRRVEVWISAPDAT